MRISLCAKIVDQFSSISLQKEAITLMLFPAEAERSCHGL